MTGTNWFFNYDIGKFEKVEFKSKWDIIKKTLKR